MVLGTRASLVFCSKLAPAGVAARNALDLLLSDRLGSPEHSNTVRRAVSTKDLQSSLEVHLGSLCDVI